MVIPQNIAALLPLRFRISFTPPVLFLVSDYSNKPIPKLLRSICQILEDLNPCFKIFSLNRHSKGCIVRLICNKHTLASPHPRPIAINDLPLWSLYHAGADNRLNHWWCGCGINCLALSHSAAVVFSYMPPPKTNEALASPVGHYASCTFYLLVGKPPLTGSRVHLPDCSLSYRYFPTAPLPNKWVDSHMITCALFFCILVPPVSVRGSWIKPP